MKKVSIKALIVILTLSIFLTGCGGGKSANTKTEKKADTAKTETTTGAILHINNHSEPASLDPALAKGTHESWILGHIFEGLMGYDEKGELVPAMAKKVDVSEDKLKYTFTLRDDAKWSNGEPVTAHDFEFAWKRVLDPKLASDYAYQLFYIKGAEEYNTGKGSVDNVAVHAKDDKTLEVELKKPTPYFEGLTAFYTYYPVNKATVEKNPDWAKDPAKTEFVCNGPFKVTDWKHNDSVQVVKNDKYYNADKVRLGGIDFDILEDDNTAYQKYQGGEYDFITSPATAVIHQLKEKKDPQLVIEPKISTYYFEFNTKKAPLDNAKVRRALSMAIDRQSIIDNITQAGQKPAEGIVPFGLKDETGKDFRESNGNLIQENVAEAKKLLEEGLKESNKTMDDLNKMTIVYNTSEGHKKIAQAIQEMWKKNLGIQVGLENMEFKTLLDRKKQGNYFIARAGWVGDYEDPMTMLDMWTTGNPQNTAFYSNPKFDELIAKAKESTDDKARMEDMKAAEKILMEDLPMLPVYFYTQVFLQKPYVKGVVANPIKEPILTYAELDKK